MKALVSYAGNDRVVIPDGISTRALNMFQSGHDTAYIASSLLISEADALQLVTEERSRRKGLPNPYEAAR